MELTRVVDCQFTCSKPRLGAYSVAEQRLNKRIDSEALRGIPNQLSASFASVVRNACQHLARRWEALTTLSTSLTICNMSLTR